jgi:hypothetical protein
LTSVPSWNFQPFFSLMSKTLESVVVIESATSLNVEPSSGLKPTSREYKASCIFALPASVAFAGSMFVSGSVP